MDGGRPDRTAVASGDYRGLFDQSAVPLALVSARGEPHFVAASRGFLNTFDLRRPAVIGHPLADLLLTPEAGAGLGAAISRCLVTNETVRTDVEMRAEASRRFVGLVVHGAHARGFSNHVVLEVVGRGHAVFSAEQRRASLFDQADGAGGETAIFIHDLRSQRVRYVDGGLARRMGLSGGALHVRDFAGRLHPDDRAEQTVFRASRESLTDQEFATQTLRLRDRTGEWRLISFRTRVLRRDREGAPRLMLGNATDITDYAAAAVEAAGVSVARAEENERALIGRELHDSTSQYLVAADLGLARVLQSRGLSAEDRARLTDVQASLGAAQSEIRAFAYFLHPPELRELGLLKTMEKFCAGFARRSGLAIDFTAPPLPQNLSPDAEHALFRVCQEALMNVYRHAFARRVTVALQMERGQLTMEIRDDGIGVDGVDRFEHGGMGVAGMKARMLGVGGDLSLDYLGSGLAVIARVPAPYPNVALAAG